MFLLLGFTSLEKDLNLRSKRYFSLDLTLIKFASLSTNEFIFLFLLYVAALMAENKVLLINVEYCNI